MKYLRTSFITSNHVYDRNLELISVGDFFFNFCNILNEAERSEGYYKVF